MNGTLPVRHAQWLSCRIENSSESSVLLRTCARVQAAARARGDTDLQVRVPAGQAGMGIAF